MQHRYIHAPEAFSDVIASDHSGFSACYGRVAEGVHFAYSLCHYRDVYSKSMGELLTHEKINRIKAPMATWDRFNDAEKGVYYFDPKSCVGLVSVGVFKGYMLSRKVLDEKTIANFTMFDFAHPFILNCVSEFIFNSLTNPPQIQPPKFKGD